MVKGWQRFEPNFQLLCHHFVAHGVGIPYFPDNTDWRWSVAGLEDFKVPRGVRVVEEDVEMAVCLRDMQVTELYALIKDLDKDDKRWNVDEVYKAMLSATGKQYTPNAVEEFQRSVKNNDLGVGAGKLVKVAHGWVKEFSGKVSHYISLQEGGNKDYLFKGINRFNSINECFVFFTYGIGTNGTLHSIRGYAHKLFPFSQVLNRLRSNNVNSAMMSGSLVLQPESINDAEDNQIMFYDGCAVIPPNVKVITGALPNPSQNVLPVIRDLTLTMQNNTGSYQARGENPMGQERTKYEVQAQLGKESMLSSASVNLFYQPWKRLLNEMFRRIRAKDVRSDDPGGREIFDFRKRCAKRGVPLEAIYSVYRVEPMRAMGQGSPGTRSLELEQYMSYFGSLGPEGQNNLLRAKFAQAVGWGQVDRFVPKLNVGGKTPIDVQLAELQNVAMSNGTPMTVSMGDQHFLHAQIHFPSLEQDLDLLESGQDTPELLRSAQIKITHISEHIGTIKPDGLQKELFAELRRQFNNASQRVEAAMYAAEKQRDREQGSQAPMSPELQKKIADHQLHQKFKVEDHELNMYLKDQEAAQKRALKDAEKAAKIRAEEEARRIRQMAQLSQG